jgi:NADH-quinone oxidoreductase subunit M
VVITFASVGVPGTNGFVGEFMVIVGAMTSQRLGAFAGFDATFAAAGVILAAVYMLSLTQRVFFGPIKNPKNRGLSDVNTREVIALTPLVLMVFVIGLFPSIFLEPMKPSVEAFYERYHSVWMEDHNDPTARLLPPDTDAALEKGAPVEQGRDSTKETH